jgi:hypothetical protein
VELYLHSLNKVNDAHMNFSFWIWYGEWVGGVARGVGSEIRLGLLGSYVIASVVCGDSTLRFGAYSSKDGSQQRAKAMDLPHSRHETCL